MRAALLFSALLLVPACRPPKVSKAADAPLQVTPGALDFGQVYVGATASLTLTLRNEGKVARAARLELEAPFTSQPTALTVGGGDAVEVLLTVTPTAPGTSSATVRVDETDVELSVTAVAVPACEVPGPCERAHFDLARGECVRETSGDGSSCSAPCVTDGVCTAGVCRGQAATCDDENLCTQDACSETGRCVHLSTECAPPDDPCQAAYCDAVSGCQKQPVGDGTRCGRDDCARNTARVCIGGACVTRTRPQGELCFETLVGVAAGPGLVDARGDEARFLRMRTATTDRWGNTWVFGGGGVRRVTPGGVVTTVIRSAGGNLAVDGVGVGTIVSPRLPTTDAFGNAYVLDMSDCVRKVTPTGVLSTIAGSCSPSGASGLITSLAVLSDGRVIFGTGSSLNVFLADGGVEELLRGFGPLTETAAGELVFSDLSDAGELQVLALARDGTTRAVPAGDTLASVNVDGGCLLSLVGADGGVIDQGRLDLACYLSSPNITTFTGSPVFTVWLGRDGRAYVFERGVLLRQIADGGFADLAGLNEEAGTTDGPAPAARLNVTAGFGNRATADLVTVRPDGKVLLSDGQGQALRTYADDGGLETLGSAALAVTMIQPAADGFWVKSGNNLHWLSGESLGPAQPLGPYPGGSASYDSEAYFEADAGAWLLGDGVLMRLGAQHELRGGLTAGRTLRDGPWPELDGGWLQLSPDAGTADFNRLHSPVELSAGSVALLDLHSVRVLSSAGLQTLAGGASAGFVDGPASVARFNGPLGLARAPNGDLYIADTENNAVRLLTASGQVRTVGRLTDRPSGIAVAPNGDVYVLVRHALLRGR